MFFSTTPKLRIGVIRRYMPANEILKGILFFDVQSAMDPLCTKISKPWRLAGDKDSFSPQMMLQDNLYR